MNRSTTIDHPTNGARLRAIVQHANMQFSRQMQRFGAKYKITEKPEELNVLDEDEGNFFELDDSYLAVPIDQTTLTHAEAVRWVQDVLERSRGRELPGNFNPTIISELFWDQSGNWQELASTHVDRVASYCARFVKSLLMQLVPDDVFNKVMLHKVEPALKYRAEMAHAKLAEIMEDKDDHPITYNHYYTTTMQKMRADKQAREMKKLASDSTQLEYDHNEEEYKRVLRPEDLVKAIAAASVEQDMLKFSAEDALICQMAFYKVSKGTSQIFCIHC